jgi:DNA topoisomerase-1
MPSWSRCCSRARTAPIRASAPPAAKFGAFVGCSNYPECRYTRPFASENGNGEAADADLPRELGTDPETGEPISLRSGRFGLFVQRGEADGEKPARASIPKDVDAATIDLDTALKLLSLPRQVGAHPETGEPITASIGRYGPYLQHQGKYARLGSTAEVFEIGMNAAVAKLADAANGGRARRQATALKELGKHPESGAELKVMDGRYGPYVTDGATNATLPKGTDPQALTLEAAAQLIDEKAAKGPVKKGRRKTSPKKKSSKSAKSTG